MSTSAANTGSNTGGNAAGGNTGGGQAAGNGGAQQQPARSSGKAPFFEGAFELYRAELELFLDDRNTWNIVTGDEERPATGDAEQAEFDRRDRLARATILRGLRGGRKTEDAAKVCGLATAHEMWETLVSDYTQRNFSYAVLLRRQLYQCSHQQDQLMANYLRTMTHLRQQLRNVGSEHAIGDDEMARLLLMGVAMTHRELVEQFDLPTRQGSPPTLQQVTNALRSRDERDRMANGIRGGQGGGLVMDMNGGAGGRGNGGNGVGACQGGRGGRKSLPKCYHCKKPGHLKRDCYQYKNKQAKVKANQSSEVTKKTWAKDKAKKEPRVIEHMAFLSNGDEDSSGSEDDEMVGMVQPATGGKHSGEWMLDTGTSTHVCIDQDNFVTQKRSKTRFKVWDGQVTRGVMSGEVVIYTKNLNSAGLVKLELSNVEYSPHGSVNLISLGLMEDNGWEMTSGPSGESPRRIFLEQPQARERLEFVKRGKHYWLKTVEMDALGAGMAMMTVNADANELMRWHERLGHLHVAAIKHMMDNGTVAGMKIPAGLFKQKFSCLSCMSAKRKRMSYKASAAEKRTKVNYERLTSDTCDMGKFLPGLGSIRYFQLIHDEGSRYKWCYPLKSKSDANENTIRLMTELLAAGHRIKIFTSDGGGEFVNSELKLFMAARGIRFIPTHPYTPEENALVEKLNGVLVNKMRAAMHAADLPNRLWPEVLQYIVDIDNMSPTRALQGKTPSEKLLGTVPNVAKIRVCGSVGFVFIAKRKDKLCPKAEPALLLGFARSTTGYRLLHLRTGQIVEARDVKFREDITVSRKYISALLMGKSSGEKIPFVPLPVEYVAGESVRAGAEDSVTSSLSVDQVEVAGADGAPGSGGESSSSGSDESDSDSAGNLATAPAAASGQATGDTRSTANNAAAAEGTTGAASANATPAAGNTGPADPAPATSGGRRQTQQQRMQNANPPRRSTRTRRQSVRLNGYQLMLEEQFLGTPETVEEALRSPQRAEWQAALKAEYESLLKNGTWKLVDRPKSSSGKRAKVLTTKWVLRIKRDENGNILRYKARLVIHGFKQRFGVEYWDTYSPVVRLVTMLLVLLIALFLGLEARHIDVETAFLNSLLKGVMIYMEQPRYFDDGTGRVCLLLKGIYGLKQAARIWYQTLHAHLVEIGFRRCAFDVGLYVRYIDGRVVLVTVYVDDMMVIGKPHDIDGVIEELRQKFVMKDLGRVKHLLSMEIHYEPGVMLCLSQSAYIDRLLEQFGMSKASTVGSPQMHNEKMLPLEKDKNKINDSALPYRQLVGKLQYLVSCTRPDIANAVRCLGRHAGSYTKENFTSAKRVLQYLAGTRTYGLVYRRSSDVQGGKLQLSAYSDADHANCPDTSRSISGHVLKLNNWSFGFKSKKQNAVTDGTCKSELVAASTCVENLLWAKELLEEIGMTVDVPKLFLDNQSALKVCKTVGNYEGVKRYAKLGHKIAELVEGEALTLEYVSTSENIADMFTKALGPQRFSLLRELLGVTDVAGARLQRDQEA